MKMESYENPLKQNDPQVHMEFPDDYRLKEFSESYKVPIDRLSMTADGKILVDKKPSYEWWRKTMRSKNNPKDIN